MSHLSWVVETDSVRLFENWDVVHDCIAYSNSIERHDEIKFAVLWSEKTVPCRCFSTVIAALADFQLDGHTPFSSVTKRMMHVFIQAIPHFCMSLCIARDHTNPPQGNTHSRGDQP